MLSKRVGKRLRSKVRLRESWDKAMQGGTRLSREKIEYLTKHEDWSGIDKTDQVLETTC